MAKVGYIFRADPCESYEFEINWMKEYGCIRIVEEMPEDERIRPEWKTLLMNLHRNDELVISRFSNALRGTRELSFFLELCRVKVIRIISINDEIDSKDILFPQTKASRVLEVVGSLPSEVAELKKSTTHISNITQPQIKVRVRKNKNDRDLKIINMYKEGYPIDEIWHKSGFSSRSSVFRILAKHGIPLSRGRSGPIKKKSERENKE